MESTYKEYCYNTNNCDHIVIDFVCVYNDLAYFNDELLKTLNMQESDIPFRLIGINNTNNQYSSMAEAYNSLEKYVAGEYVIFLHQDIRFQTKNSVSNLVSYLNKLDDNAVFGSAGAMLGTRQTIISEDKIIPVETVDECIFGMKKERFMQLKFNETLCDNWHMYAVEICLHNKVNGGNNVVIPMEIVHLSPGQISKSYIDTLYKIINYYKNKGFSHIWTTCAKVNLDKPYHIYIYIYIYGASSILC